MTGSPATSGALPLCTIHALLNLVMGLQGYRLQTSVLHVHANKAFCTTCAEGQKRIQTTTFHDAQSVSEMHTAPWQKHYRTHLQGRICLLQTVQA